MTTNNLNLKSELIDDVAVITVEADHLDAGNVDLFRDEIMQYLHQRDKILLDISSLDFIDSSGLGTILFCQRDIVSNNGALKICGVNQSVRLFFELVRMHKVVDIEPTREQALEHFKLREE